MTQPGPSQGAAPPPEPPVQTGTTRTEIVTTTDMPLAAGDIAPGTIETFGERWRRLAAVARDQAPRHLLLLLLIFLILYLVAAATGRSDIIQISRAVPTPAADLTPVLDTNGANQSNVSEASANRSLPDGQTYPVAAEFSSYYNDHNGSLVFGRPISPVMTVNGRTAQWYERARLERWPQNAGTKYEIQPALLGVEYTQGIAFPNQQFFVSNPETVYSAVTNHGVSERFYQFWLSNGGLDMFGYPLSDELVETMPQTGEKLTVQYFERARLELHPGTNGQPDQVMIGLLGRELYINDSAPNIVSAAKPTPVPVP